MISSATYEESALRYVKNFQYKYGQELLHLAFHAAVPVVINADFVHLLRINFFLGSPESLPFTSEADLLLSSLCYDIGDGLYEIAPNVRNILLQKLVKEYSQERIREVATLLWQYNDHYAPWKDRPELERAQQLTALNFLDSLRAKQWLAEAEVSSDISSSVEREWFVVMWKEIEQVPEMPTTTSLLKELKFGELLRQFRMRANMTQQALADQLGIHRRTISAWEHSTSLPKTRTMIAELASILRLDEQETNGLLNLDTNGEDSVNISTMNTFGELLKEFRKRQDISQKALGDKLGYSGSTISFWEQSAHFTGTREIVLEIAKVLNLSLEDATKLLRGALFSPIDAETYAVYLAIGDELNKTDKPLQDITADNKSSEIQESSYAKDKSDAKALLTNDIDQPKQKLIMLNRSGQDEGLIIDDMLTNRDSPYWEQYQEYVSYLVKRQAANLHIDSHEDITQEAMYRLMHNLPMFRREAKLTTWIALIVRSCIVEAYRKAGRASMIQIPTPEDTFDDSEDQIDNPNYLSSEFVSSLSSEASAVTKEELQKATSALEEYIETHKNKERNRAIIRRIIFEGQSSEMVAKQLGVSAAVVGYVVRSAQSFTRQRLGR